jgi:hypothetical protein
MAATPRRKTLPLVCGLALGAVVAVSSGSAVGSGRPGRLACAKPSEPRIALDAKADAIALWLCLGRSEAVQAAVRPASTRAWGALRDVVRLRRGATPSGRALAVDLLGDAVAR